MLSARFPGELKFVAAFVGAAALFAVWFVFTTGHIVWVALYLIGVSLLCYSLAILRRVLVAKRWPSTTGRVLRASVRDVFVPDENTNTQYAPAVSYEYLAGSALHKSNRFGVSSAGFRSVEWREVKNLLLQYQPGAAVPVRVCPDNPNWAVLQSELSAYRRSHTIAVLVGGLIVTVVSLFVGVAYAL